MQRTVATLAISLALGCVCAHLIGVAEDRGLSVVRSGRAAVPARSASVSSPQAGLPPTPVEPTDSAPARLHDAAISEAVELTPPVAGSAEEDPAIAERASVEVVDSARPHPASVAASSVVVAEPPKILAVAAVEPVEPEKLVASPELYWHDDYAEAMADAVAQDRMLLIFFYDDAEKAAREAFERRTLTDAHIKDDLSRFVLCTLPKSATTRVKGQQVVLLKHAAFAEMLGRQGVAIVDLAHHGKDYYGYVVSTFPFTPGKYVRSEALSIILSLPPGTLTQRTMIYAVRIHPEAPASTQGKLNGVLADEAKSHSTYQAAILVQGHHNWDSRFQRINARLPSGLLAQEVVAESWPNEGLVEACVDCVHSWRQSPGHWSAVQSRHPLFGFDIKRGRNGIWYATGIFGKR